MAITHTKDNQLNSAPVKVSNYIRIILALALSGLAELASLFFIQPLLPVLAVEYDVPVSQVSIILSAETALLAIGLLFTGTLSDHYGRKKLIIVSLLLGGLLTMLCPLVESWRCWWPCVRLLAWRSAVSLLPQPPISARRSRRWWRGWSPDTSSLVTRWEGCPGVLWPAS
ncbi:permease [Klebsiella michiganensis]|nr:permease [Klebsiella michiganensis]